MTRRGEKSRRRAAATEMAATADIGAVYCPACYTQVDDMVGVVPDECPGCGADLTGLQDDQGL